MYVNEEITIERDKIGLDSISFGYDDLQDYIMDILDNYEYFIYKLGYDLEEIQQILFDKLKEKFNTLDSNSLELMKKRALAHIVNAIIQKRGFYSVDDWKLVRKEIYVKSGVEEFVYGTVDSYLKENENEIFETKEDYILECMDYEGDYTEISSLQKEIKSDIEKYKTLTDEEIEKLILDLNTNVESEEEYYPQDLMSFRQDLNYRIRNLTSASERIKGSVDNCVSWFGEEYDRIKEQETKNINEYLKKNLRKNFILFLIKRFYPDFDSKSINVSDELITEIYISLSSTEAWKVISPGVKEEFSEMLNGGTVVSSKKK